MTCTTHILSYLLLIFLFLHRNTAIDGKWNLLLSNVGISAMHMQLLNTDRVIMFDRTDFGQSNISLPNGICRNDPNDTALIIDCTAHSVEYDVLSNTIRPLMVLTDVWCSSASLMSDGTLLQTGGFNDGDHVVRMYKPAACSNNNDSCGDWQEIQNGLTQRRWYATNHILPDGQRQIIIGGRRQFNYEFYPKSSSSDRFYTLPFLVETNDPNNVENNLYPFVFLIDQLLFIYANNRAIMFDYRNNSVVKTYPIIPGGDPRSYPSSGSAVLLPLRNNNNNNVGPEVLVCGGAPKGAFVNVNNGIFSPALDTCGRIRINDLNPQWVMETMPMGRVMGDMVLLPNGFVLIINGAASGTAGWESGRNPVLAPVMYRPDNQIGSRFEVQNPTSTPRMYHSTAILLRDGRILVGGSNPHIYYNFTGVQFPTDLTLEAFSPFYFESRFDNLRPRIVSPNSQIRIGYGQQIAVRFSVPPGRLNGTLVSVTMVAPSFNTHSFSMNQRLLVLNISGNVVAIANSTYQIRVTTPGSSNLAPSGYYLLFVVYRDVPSQGIWVRIT